MHTVRLVTALAVAASAAWAQDYRFADLGAPRQDLLSLRALINNRGTLAITGVLPRHANVPVEEDDYFEHEPDRGYIFRGGAFTKIPDASFYHANRLMALNDHDVIAGHFFVPYDFYQSFWYDARTKQLKFLRQNLSPTAPRNIGLLFTNGLTNSGRLLGAEIFDFDLPWVYDVTTGDLVSLGLDGVGLGYPVAYAINNREWVSVEDADSAQTYLYHAGTGALTPLDFLATAMSDSGILLRPESGNRLAFWRDGLVSHVTLPGPGAPSFPDPAPDHVINDWGHVVGTYLNGSTRVPYLYDGTAIRPLNTLVPASQRGGWTFESATGINDLGQIVGSMVNSTGQRRLYRLSPSASVVSDSTWKRLSLPSSTGRLTVTYDVVPMGNALDAVTGLSLGAADAYTDLAAIVRFNVNGRIDARNGRYYQALNTVTYESGLSYRVMLSADLSTRRFSVTVTPAGGSPVALAKNFAFRSEQAAATRLDALSVRSDHGGLAVGNVKLGDAAPPSGGLGPIVSGGRWAGVAIGARTGTFTVRFKATPASAPLDGVAGVSLGLADGYEDLAANLRFNLSGRVDARRGSSYAAANTFRYSGNTTYDVTLTVNLATRRYSATIAKPGSSPVTIANNYAFRTGQSSATSLNSLNVHSSGGFLTLHEIQVP